MELFTDVAAQYADFATYAGDSPCFEEWARAVVDDDEVLTWIATLPPVKQTPTLVFAAARWHGVPAPGPYAGLRDALLGDDGSIRATILARATASSSVVKVVMGATGPKISTLLTWASGGTPSSTVGS